jgi:hypothetical protein
MNIAIIELERHTPFLKFLINFLEGEEITCYFSKEFYNKNDTYINNCLNSKVCIQKNNESLKKFLLNKEEEFNSYDLVYISTIQNNLKYFSYLNLQSKVILNVHNLNAWFHPNKKASFKDIYNQISESVNNTFLNKILPNNILKSIKLFKYFFEEFFNEEYRKKILNYVDVINFYHPEMNDRLSEFQKKQYIITNLPFSLSSDLNLKVDEISSENDILKIGIPGGIIPDRRDYVGFINSLKKFKLMNNKKIIIFLIGAFKDFNYKKQIINLISEIKNDQIEFKFSDEIGFINQNQYDEWMKTVDVLFSPLKVKKISKIYTEYYGQTKATGADFDAIFYRKPIIMPKAYKPLPYIKEIYYFYDEYEELNDIINKLFDSEKLISKKQLVSNRVNYLKNQITKNNFFDKIRFDK